MLAEEVYLLGNITYIKTESIDSLDGFWHDVRYSQNIKVKNDR